MRPRTSKRRSKGGSGIFVPTPTGKEFEEFLRHASSVERLAQGSFGVTLKITYDPNAPVVSPFKLLDPAAFGQPATVLVAKFCLVENGGATTFLASQKDIQGISKKDFAEEVNLQTEIYQKTMRYGAPLCPAVVHAEVLDNNSPIPQLLADKMDPTVYNDTLEDLFDIVAQMDGGAGMIVMEMAVGYTTWFRYEDAARKMDAAKAEAARPDVYAALLQLTHFTGYSQGDFHRSNVMVKPDPLFAGHFTVLILDYGLAIKLTYEQKRRFEELYQAKNYLDALKFYCNPLRRKDHLDLLPHEVYRPVCVPEQNKTFTDAATFNASVQAAIDRLTDHEERNIQLMEQHVVNWNSGNNNGVKPERLPLANRFRNQLFSGVDVPLPADSATEEDTSFQELLREWRNNPDPYQKAIMRGLTLLDLKQSREKLVQVTLRFLDYINRDQTAADRYVYAFLCSACCEKAVVKSTGQPCDEIEDFENDKLTNYYFDDYDECDRYQRPPKNFLQFLSPRGEQTLQQMSTRDFVQLLCDPNTFGDPLDTARKLNDDPSGNSSNPNSGSTDSEQSIDTSSTYADPLPFADAQVGGARRTRRRRTTTRRLSPHCKKRRSKHSKRRLRRH